MIADARHHLRILACLIAGIAGAGGGCASLNTGSFDPAPAAEAKNLPKCAVEFRALDGSRERTDVALKGAMTVNDVLEQVEARSRFARLKITIARRSPEGRPMRLPVSFNRRLRQVEPVNNYAVFANDVIIVEDDPHSLFADMVDALSNPSMLTRQR